MSRRREQLNTAIAYGRQIEEESEPKSASRLRKGFKETKRMAEKTEQDMKKHNEFAMAANKYAESLNIAKPNKVYAVDEEETKGGRRNNKRKSNKSKKGTNKKHRKRENKRTNKKRDK